MADFKFRLEKLLELRRMEEDWARDTYLEAQAKRIVAEHERDALARILKQPIASTANLQELRAAQVYRERIEDEVRASETVIGILEQEEEGYKQVWLDRRKDAEALEKLKEKDFQEWMLEENRREQRDIDEWAVLRRAS